MEERQAYNAKCKQKMRELRNKRKNLNNHNQSSDEEVSEFSDVVKRINEEHRYIKETEKVVEYVEPTSDCCVCDTDINCPHCEAVK